MPLFGWLHHRQWLATKERSYKRHIHVWGGRILLLLSFIAAITGLRLSKVNTSSYVAYGVVVGIIAITYAGVWIMKNRKAKQSVEETELEAVQPVEEITERK